MEAATGAEPKITNLKRMAAACRGSYNNPEFFFDRVLGATLDGQQKQLIANFCDCRRMAVKSGHSCGKDWCAARLGLWFHYTHYPSLVVITGPTERQVKNIVWGEIKAAWNNAKYELGGEMFESELRHKTPEGKYDSEHKMIGFTAKDPEAFQGLHSPNLLVIVTEAPGIEAKMWPAIQSLLTSVGNAKIICIGNATFDPESEFYAMFTRKANLYKRYTLNSEKSDYCSKAWIEEMKEEYTEESPVYQGRVLGVFPTNLSDAVFPLGWIEKAQVRWKEPRDETASKTRGCDVARAGTDLTVMYEGQGIHYEIVHKEQGQDLMMTAGWCMKAIKDGLIPENLRIDDTGLGGGVTDRLREQEKESKFEGDVTAINFGAAAQDDEKWVNCRTEMFWSLRNKLRLGEIALDPKDVELVKELTSIRIEMRSDGRQILEDKKKTKKRVGRSPDRADALALAALPPDLAEGIAIHAKSNRGMLALMRERRKAKKKAEEPATTKPMSEVPGATEMLGGGR